MSAVYARLLQAWRFVTGLRVTTRAWRAHQQAVEDGLMRHIHAAELEARTQAAEKREAQRILAILSEPLKDWELADFPPWAVHPDRSKGLEQAWPMEARERAHIWDVVQAYRTVARDAAQARMSVTTNDMLRGRTWADRPVRTLP